MQLKELIQDDDAVSPVIGVILMVAITVILAAVIGTFVLGLGDQVQNTSPQASFSFDLTTATGSADSLTVTHDGGDSITTSQLSVSIAGATASGGDPNGETAFSSLGVSATEVSAGTTATVNESNLGLTTNDDLDLSGATVRVVWDSNGDDKTATLGKFSGPNA